MVIWQGGINTNTLVVAQTELANEAGNNTP
jgi:hypothetical protein